MFFIRNVLNISFFDNKMSKSNITTCIFLKNVINMLEYKENGEICMARRYRRKKSKAISIFLSIILLFMIGLLLYKFYNDNFNTKTKNNNLINKIENKISKMKKK